MFSVESAFSVCRNSTACLEPRMKRLERCNMSSSNSSKAFSTPSLSSLCLVRHLTRDTTSTSTWFAPWHLKGLIGWTTSPNIVTHLIFFFNVSNGSRSKLGPARMSLIGVSSINCRTGSCQPFVMSLASFYSPFRSFRLSCFSVSSSQWTAIGSNSFMRHWRSDCLEAAMLLNWSLLQRWPRL